MCVQVVVFSIEAFKLLPTSQSHHRQEARVLLANHLRHVQGEGRRLLISYLA